MPKKSRSQRRKKGAPIGAPDDADGGGDLECLSESYTVADSVISGDPDHDDLDAFAEFDNDDDLATAEAEEEHVTRAALSSQSRQAKLLDVLSLASTLTSEKRASRREQCLRALFRAVTQHATGEPGREAVLSRVEGTILPACLQSLRAGTPAEQYAACRVLEATAVVLGGDMDDYCEAVTDPLTRAVRATGRASQVRVAAIRALSMALFVCGTDMVATSEAGLDLCEAVCGPRYRGEDVDPHLRAAALDCWALLSTTLVDASIAGDALTDELVDGGNGRGVAILPLLQDCIDHSNVELRSAAGECVALIHEARLNMGIEDDEGDNITERRYSRGSWDGTEYEVLMDEVKQRIAELSVESGRRLSKKAKKEQRATFREFMATIVDDESPSVVVAFRGGTLSLSTWKEIVQLNFVRHCLQAGFQIQLMTNATLQAIFGADGSVLGNAAAASMSKIEKRLMLSKTSEAAKSADKHMTRERRKRTNAKNHFLAVDEEG